MQFITTQITCEDGAFDIDGTYDTVANSAELAACIHAELGWENAECEAADPNSDDVPQLERAAVMVFVQLPSKGHGEGPDNTLWRVTWDSVACWASATLVQGSFSGSIG